MNDTVVVALISTSGTFLTAVVALVLSYRGFASIDGRFGSLERRLDRIENDYREFYETQADYDKRLSNLEKPRLP